jgi:hypothetical protein
LPGARGHITAPPSCAPFAHLERGIIVKTVAVRINRAPVTHLAPAREDLRLIRALQTWARSIELAERATIQFGEESAEQIAACTASGQAYTAVLCAIDARTR